MNTIIAECNNWHLWTTQNGVMLSDERNKELRQFETIDDAINWLWVCGNKETARGIHNQTKAQLCT